MYNFYMKVFITATFKNGENKVEIERLCSLINSTGFEAFCFIRDVENYSKMFNDPKELMIRAKEEIEKCDLLLIDLTNKPTGRAYEAGMAYAFGKKVITIIKKGTELKDTTRGISDSIIEYDNLEDIVEPLKIYYKKLANRSSD